MAHKKTKYDLLLKSLEIPKDMYYNDWDWGYYDEGDWDGYYEDYDVEYDYLEVDSIDSVYIVSRGRGFISHQVRNRLPYKQIDMNSIYSKEKRREIKINKILGIQEDFRKPTIGDLLKNKLNIDENRDL